MDVTADLTRAEVRHEGRLVGGHDRVWARRMTITDPAHVAAAKVLREQFQRPRPAIDPDQGLARDLADYDRAFGLSDNHTDKTDSLADGLADSLADGLADGQVA